MTYETISLELDAKGVAWLMLNQPDKHNAMSATTIDELTDVTKRLEQNDQVRVVVLTGTGKSFCAGGDLGWMRSQFEADRETRIAEAMKLAGMLNGLNTLAKPVIGKIQGQAFGGGIGLMSICDVTIGIETAKFALTETRLGLIPATISPYVLARMGEANARQVFFSGKPFMASRAVELGLLSECVPADQLDEKVEQEIAHFLQAAPGAVARAKRLARRQGPVIDDELIRHTAEQLADCWESEETHQGIAAFFAKQKPDWQREA